MIDRFKGFGKRKIHLTVKTSFFLTAGSLKCEQMHLKSDKSEIINEFHTGKVNEKCFELFVQRYELGLTLFRMDFDCSQIGGSKKATLPKIYHTYPAMIKLGTVMLFLKKISKIYISHDTPLEFCWYQHFFTPNQQVLADID